MINCNMLAKAATKAGMMLLESGAETFRVEDTMRRICLSYGADVVDSYATPTLLIVSFSLDEELCHNVKRTQIKSVDLSKIDKVNQLSRHIVSEKIPIEEFYQQLVAIDELPKYKRWIMILGAAICTMGFSWFFDGTLKDALCAFVFGGMLKWIMEYFDKIDFGSFFKYLLSGAMVTLLSILCMRISFCDTLDNVVISVNMLLVPGLAITNAIRDTLSGDLVSGLARTAEAIFIAAAVAIGSGMIFMVLKG